MFVKLFYALLFGGAGVLILKNRKTVKAWTGNFDFAEKYLGKGSSYFIILLIGALFIYLGVKFLFNGVNIFPTNPN